MSRSLPAVRVARPIFRIYNEPRRRRPRPPVDVRYQDTAEIASSLIRVLDDDGNAVGPWAPELDRDSCASACAP
jgi:hypothetical protein